MSASLVYARLRERRDRVTIPLLAGSRSGVVLRPEATRVLCVYSGDGATALANCDPPGVSEACVPGCVHPSGYCNPLESMTDGWCQCSIGWCKGEPLRPQPWHPAHLAHMIRQYDEFGLPPREANGSPAAGQGWNEVVVSGDHWERSLPRAIEGFFYVRDSPWDTRTKTRDMAEQFAVAYNYGGRPDAPPPLMMLRPDDWAHPFAPAESLST